MIERLQNLTCDKFSFGKNSEFFEAFCMNINAYSMYSPGFGYSIPDKLSMGDRLRAVFNYVNRYNGKFLFNISSVDIVAAMKGFGSFEEAAGNNMITEWELSVILQNDDYLKRTIFHNGFTEFKLIKNKGFKIKWK